MKWLFWKEYRQNRPIVIALLVLLVVPHLFGLWVTWAEMHRPRHDANAWIEPLVIASLYSLGIAQIAFALIGGNAIAGERADRSAEFQAYLPLAREKILAGKILMALAIAAIIWLTNPPILWCLHYWFHPETIREFFIIMINIAITGLVVFSVAWLFSSILSSPTFATVAGLAAPLIIWSIIIYTAYLIHGDQWHPETGKIFIISYIVISLIVAPVSFGIGTWLYLRRVEP